jgi:hypothetical protein
MDSDRCMPHHVPQASCREALMIRTATLEGEQAHRRHLTLANGTTYWRSDLILSAETDSPAPQAFLIEQDPNTVVRAHFHMQDQFQVVANGGGTLGRHALEPISVHYASRHTGYGPITSGAQGLWYFTLRAQTTPLAYFLPESRGEMADLPRRNLIRRAVAPEDLPARVARSAATMTTVIEPQDDGVAAWLLQLPPDAPVVLPERGAGGDRFYLITDGDMRADAAHLPRFAAAFASADEPRFDGVAGPQGLDVLVLQFARASTP